MNSILVFCGANRGAHPDYAEAAHQLGEKLAQRGYRTVTGAGKVGLMGVVADAALAAGGAVTGVIPFFLRRKEVCHEALTELHIVDSMHERKVKMAELADGVVVLPGGYGTQDELFEMLTLAQLGKYPAPIGILNVRGYYNHLIDQLDHMAKEGFLKPVHRQLLLVAESVEDLLTQMEKFQPTPREGKWLDLERM